MLATIRALALSATLALPLLSPKQPYVEPFLMDVRLTVYLPTGNVAYSGVMPYWGSAACSWNIPLGSRLRFPDGHTVICEDRGLLGWNGWVDVYVPDWATGVWLQSYYGHYTTVEVIRWGYEGS